MRGQKARGVDVKEVSAPKEAGSPVRISAIAGVRARKAPKPEIIEQVGLRLRGVYNDVLMQPIPDRFLDLLRKLEADAPAQPQQMAGNTGSKKDPK